MEGGNSECVCVRERFCSFKQHLEFCTYVGNIWIYIVGCVSLASCCSSMFISCFAILCVLGVGGGDPYEQQIDLCNKCCSAVCWPIHFGTSFCCCFVVFLSVFVCFSIMFLLSASTLFISLWTPEAMCWVGSGIMHPLSSCHDIWSVRAYVQASPALCSSYSFPGLPVIHILHIFHALGTVSLGRILSCLGSWPSTVLELFLESVITL